MQAQSLLGSARVIDKRFEDLLSSAQLKDTSIAWTNAAVARHALGDVAEQLRASVPLPAGDRGTADESFSGLLDALATCKNPTVDLLAQSVSGGETTIERLCDAGRIQVHGSMLVVPLGSHPDGRNWWSLLEFLCEWVSALTTKADRVRDRVIVDGGGTPLVTVWNSVVERLDVLRDVLDEMTNNGCYTGRSMHAADGPTEFVTWTADQFRRKG